METIGYLSTGFLHVLTIGGIAAILSGLIIGIVAGALPGINFVNAMALSLPFTLTMSPETAMIFLSACYCGGVYGGSISSILINIPGSPGSVPAMWDGYPMTLRGKSARALGIAVTASAIGGVASALLMTFGSPPFAKIALTFSHPEFFAATVLGMVSIVTIAQGNMVRGIASMLGGVLIGTVGLDAFYGVPRLTFGIAYLDSGINFVVVLIGIFAISEVLTWVSEKHGSQIKVAKAHTQLPSLKELFQLRGSMARGSAIGCGIGLIPGAGALVGAVIAYGVEKQVSKRGHQFGTGVEEGLAAPEAAKNATTGTAAIPLLTLGIPGSAATAVMMIALTMQGVQLGPMLFINSTGLVYTVFAAYLLANVLVLGIGPVLARGFSLLIKLPPPILFGLIVVLCFAGAFSVRNNMADVFVCFGFGIVGFVFRQCNIPAAPLVLGVILGKLAESYFLTAMAASQGDWLIFFKRPYSAVIMSITILLLLWSLWPTFKKNFGIKATRAG